MSDGRLTDAIVRTVSETLRSAPKVGFHVVSLPNVRNPYGATLKPPRKGSRGIAGMRADLRDGTITPREVAMMTIGVIADRWGLSRGGAWRARQQIVAHGLDGQRRTIDGKRKVV